MNNPSDAYQGPSYDPNTGAAQPPDRSAADETTVQPTAPASNPAPATQSPTPTQAAGDRPAFANEPSAGAAQGSPLEPIHYTAGLGTDNETVGDVAISGIRIIDGQAYLYALSPGTGTVLRSKLSLEPAPPEDQG